MRAIKGLAPPAREDCADSVASSMSSSCSLASRVFSFCTDTESTGTARRWPPGDDQAIVTSDADQHAADYRPGNAAGGPEKAEQGVNHNQLLPIEGFPRPHQRQGIKRAAAAPSSRQMAIS